MNDYKELLSQIAYCTSEEGCDGCPLNSDNILDLCVDELLEKASDAIEQLVKERDAAIADLRYQSACWNCTKNGKDCHANMPMEQPNVMCGGFEWRGVQEVEHGND